jgi:Family of unknown function (DUF5954)
MTVLGTRYRVIRADQVIRTGPLGPEPPRPTDPDPGEPGMSRQLADPADGFVIDPATATGMSEGIFRAELLDTTRQLPALPADAREDLRPAAPGQQTPAPKTPAPGGRISLSPAPPAPSQGNEVQDAHPG